MVCNKSKQLKHLSLRFIPKFESNTKTLMNDGKHLHERFAFLLALKFVSSVNALST